MFTFGFLALLSFIAVCLADLPVTPSSTPAPVLCGAVPKNIHACIGGPKLVKPEWGKPCSKQHTDECDLMTCVYEKAGWKNNEVIDKKKIAAHFEEFAKTQPEWSNAVKQVKETCLQGDLLPQGVYLKCPAYDITTCIETALVRNASPSQWSNSASCERPKQLAGACPFCPEDCFAPAIPKGSCNACLSLPRSP